ncbi:hypothetical protein MMC25_006124 [Agyrium rufum]|nr:hypothetical protein [Agyrium rufum]
MEIDTVREWLAVLQFQRETGTLDRGLAMPTVTEDLVRRLVEWLRKTYAVDEDAAIIRRIEREEEASADYAPQKYPPGTSVYGDSAWEAMMEERNKRRALEKQQKEEAEEAAKQTVNTVEGPMDVERADRPQILVRKKREESEWVKKYRERAMLSDKDQKEFPLLGRWQRLVPSMLLTGLVLGFCLALATYYIPPPRLARLFPDTPPAASTVMMLISANVAVWVLWHIPPCWRFLNRYFILVPGAPYALSILGAGFSHQQFRHLLVNMVGLWFLGTWLHDDVGRGNFLATYFGTQVIAAMGSMSVFVAQGILNTTMLGASGAIYGLLGAQFAKHWGETFRISFLPEEMNIRFGSGTILLLVAAFEIFQLTRYGLLVDRFSHLFGLGAGAIIGLLLRMKEKEGAPVEEEQVPKLREDGSKMEFPSDPVALLNKALGKGGGEIDGNDHRGGQS